MTTLPERLRASAQVLRWLPPCTESSYEILDLVAWNIDRELEEAAQALEAQREDRREVLRILYEAHRKTNPSPSLAAISAAIQHLQAVEDATSAQVAQEGGGVSASAYLAKIKADPRRAAALQRARDRAARGVATDGGQQ